MGREPRGDNSWRRGNALRLACERSAHMQLQLAPKSFIEVVPVPPARRIASVDALRGFNIFWILGGDGAIWALDDMSSGKGPVVSGIGHFLGF